MASEKRIAHPVRWRHDLLMFEDSGGNFYECREIAEALNAALEDAERYQALRAILQGDALVPNTGLGTPALRSLARMEHALTDCTAEEIDEAINAQGKER